MSRWVVYKNIDMCFQGDVEIIQSWRSHTSISALRKTCEQKKYSAAIKMYRMALDQIPNTGREIRYKIMRNIGNAFVRLGQFQDAIASFEQIMDGSPDLQTGFNLVLCYYAAGERERMKKAFSRLLSVRA